MITKMTKETWGSSSIPNWMFDFEQGGVLSINQLTEIFHAEIAVRDGECFVRDEESLPPDHRYHLDIWGPCSVPGWMLGKSSLGDKLDLIAVLESEDAVKQGSGLVKDECEII